jgi:BolA-like protein 1
VNGPLAQTIETKLRSALDPEVLEVDNESANHNVPKGSETHFRVVIVSRAFEGKLPVARHQLVYRALAEEMKPGGVHALAITSRTPAEWAAAAAANVSPPCLGGSKA